MPLHHYLPATFLANFSIDLQTMPRRDRIIFMGDKKSQKIFQVSAGDVGAVNNLYTLLNFSRDPDSIDKIWSDYEAKLHVSIPRLIVGYDLDAITWIRLLVPFVACMLVRGPDFNIRFENRIKSLFGEINAKEFLNKDNINVARTIELQRLLFPVASAKWIVINTHGSELLLTNDLGYCPFIHPRAFDYGMAIPISPNHILAISPRRNGEILRFSGGKWRPIINYTIGAFGNHEDLNRSTVSMAQRFIFSPTYALAEKYLHEFPNSQRPIEPEQLGFIDGYHSRAYEFTWHRLAIFLEENEFHNESNGEFPLNWHSLFNGWNPPVILPTNLSGFPAPLYRGKRSIYFKYYEPDDYYLLNQVMDYERMEEFDEMLNKSNLGIQNTSNEELKLEFLFSKSIALHKLGEKDKSLQIINKILETNPLFHKARLNLIANLLKENKLDEAFENLCFILEKEPNSIESRINLCNFYILKGNYSLAANEATKACVQAPEGNLLGSAHLSRGLAYLRDKEFEGAFNDFSLAQENLKEPEKLGLSYFQRAYCAIQFLEEGNSIQKSQVEPFSTTEKDDQLETNQSLFDYTLEDAINDLSESIILLPAISEVYISALDLRGNLYKRIGLLSLAYNDFSKAGEIDKINPKFSFKQGEILLELGNFPGSIEFNNKVIELSPDNGGALNNRAIANFLLGNKTEAKNDFQKAIALFGDSPERGSPLRHLTHISLIEGDLEKSINYLENSKELESQSSYNLILDGMVEFYNEKPQEALDILEEVSSQYNSACDFKIYQIFSLTSLNRNDEALTILKENSTQITKYSLRIINLHLSNLATKNPKQAAWHLLLNHIQEISNSLV